MMFPLGIPLEIFYFDLEDEITYTPYSAGTISNSKKRGERIGSEERGEIQRGERRGLITKPVEVQRVTFDRCPGKAASSYTLKGNISTH